MCFFILKTPYGSIYSKNFNDETPEPLFLSASEVIYIVNFITLKISKNYEEFITQLLSLDFHVFILHKRLQKRKKIYFRLVCCSHGRLGSHAGPIYIISLYMTQIEV